MPKCVRQVENPIEGIGIGLRACHFAHILTHRPPIPWFEATTENYMVQGGIALHNLTKVRELYPLVLHGVGMSIGSVDPLSHDYLNKLRDLVRRFQPAYVSDHLCWSSFEGQHFHELLPLPYTEETVTHVAQRILQVQDFLKQRILIENVSSYFTYAFSELSEWEFINAVANKADCYILLDINNIYVSGQNHGFDPQHYINQISKERVKQFHLAGYEDCNTYLLDTHGAEISPAVWELYQFALNRFGPVPTSIEWDNDIPSFSCLLEQSILAQQYLARAPFVILPPLSSRAPLVIPSEARDLMNGARDPSLRSG